MSETAYEMLWNCRYCGAQKLLGLTHRHCPSCGAAQEAEARYFPAEHERIAAPDHQFVGADITCRYCAAPSSKLAKNCGRCGALLAEGAPVVPRADAEAVSLPSSRPTPPRWPLWKVLVPSVALALVAVAVVLLLWRRDEHLVVAERSWSRSVSVERLGAVTRSVWCDELPADARDVTRRREQRGTSKVEDGEDCTTKPRDRGDGTFVEERDCKPRYKQEPVYDQKCRFTRDEWRLARREQAQGSASEPPRWPVVTLARSSCAVEGCEREGARVESYTVLFRDGKGEQYRCDFPEQVWAGYEQGRRYRGELRALVSSLDCSSLRPR